MARPSLPAGTLGKVSVRERAPGRWTARAKARRLSGALVELVATRDSSAEAEHALRDEFAGIIALPSIKLSATSTVAEAVKVWTHEAAAAARAGELRAQTVERYRTDGAAIVEVCGAMPLNTLVPATIQSLIHQVASTVSDASGRRFRIRLMEVMTVAVAHQALPMNPVKETKRPRRPARTSSRSALTPDQWREWVESVEAWGPRPRVRSDTRMLVDLASLAIASGLRIGEVAAARPVDFGPGVSFASRHRHSRRVRQPSSPAGGD